MPDYAEVWLQFDTAVSELYDQLLPACQQVQPAQQAQDIETQCDNVIIASSQLAEVLASGLNSPVIEERERCMLRLMAGAAADIAIASDLIGSDIGQRAFGVTADDTNNLEGLMSDLGFILQPGADDQSIVFPHSNGFRSTKKRTAHTKTQSAASESIDRISADVILIGHEAGSDNPRPPNNPF